MQSMVSIVSGLPYGHEQWLVNIVNPKAQYAQSDDEQTQLRPRTSSASTEGRFIRTTRRPNNPDFPYIYTWYIYYIYMYNPDFPYK